MDMNEKHLKLNDVEDGGEPDIPDNSPINLNKSNPCDPLQLKFQNQIFNIEVSGYSEQLLWEVFLGVLSHPDVSKSNKIIMDLAPKQLQYNIETLKKEKESKNIGSYCG